MTPGNKKSNDELVATAFDNVADVFDSTFEPSPVIQRLRKKTYAMIGELAQPKSLILDINCGTGIDVLALAGRGYTVDGTDISAKMVEQAKTKATGSGTASVEFFVSSFEALSPQLRSGYDIVLSNFGGINCSDNLAQVAGEIGRITKPGGYFVGIIMPPFSLWETVSGIAHGRWGYALRRLRGESQATGFGEKRFTVFYHSPHQIARAFRPWFRPEKIIGLSIVSPPPSAERFVVRHRRLVSILERTDGLIEWIPVIRSIGDHFMIVLRRKSR